MKTNWSKLDLGLKKYFDSKYMATATSEMSPLNLFQGGASFLVVKGLFKVYYKQQQHVMQSRRKIIDYPQDPSTPHPPPSQSPAPAQPPASSQGTEQQYLQQQQQ